MLNATQIISENLLKLDNTKGKKAQVGYDLSLKSVNKIGQQDNLQHPNKIGKVFKDKTEITSYHKYDTIQLEGAIGYLLYPGTYDITFNEGCNIPSNRVAFIKQRSSLYRNGVVINSPVFDPGFETNNMGTIMIVNEPIFIEENARVAQIYFHECLPVQTEDLYGGKNSNSQFQGDQWRYKESSQSSVS